MDVRQPRAHRQIRLEPSRHLELLRADGEALAQEAVSTPVAATSSVPGCPGWTVNDVVRHTGSVYRRTRDRLRTGSPPQEWERQPPSGGDLVSWYRESLNLVAGELAGRDPAKPADTWFEADRSTAFWYRRMALETAVHRYDVQAAVRDEEPADPVDPALAVDGIDEVLSVWLTAFARESRHPHPADWHYLDGHSVAVVTAEHRWRLEFAPYEVSVRPSESVDAMVDCEAVIAGDPSNVLLYLWGRLPGGTVALTGNPAVLVAFRKRLAAVTD
jgi:uncharacterized protein (TIGR03083 family)